MPASNPPIAIAGVVERYFEPEDTRPGRIILRPDEQDETIDLKIWLDRETRAKPTYLINLEAAIGDVHNLEGQRIMVSAKPSGEWEGRSQYNLTSVTTAKQPDATPVEPTTTALPPSPTPPAPQAAAPTGWTPSQSDQWRADGAETGNSKTNATALIVAYLQHVGELPDPEWMEMAALAVNKLAAHIRAINIGVEDIADEEDVVDNTVLFTPPVYLPSEPGGVMKV